jgi:hypothetical protein
MMLANDEGLTATYNRFHDPDDTADDIATLRRLHVQMDEAVAAAYGWSDIALGHDFHETQQGLRYTISEGARRTVLTRLLKLNHARYHEEALEGLHGKKAQANAMQQVEQGQAQLAEKIQKQKKDEYRRKQQQSDDAVEASPMEQFIQKLKDDADNS